MKRLLVLLAAVMLAGCFKYPPPPPSVHCPDWQADPYARRMDPALRLREIDRCGGLYWDLRKTQGPSEIPARRYVLESWMYLSLGLDYEAKGDRGAAARAWWASLSVVGSDNIASRAERERMKRAAFEGLARVSKVEGQTDYSALLTMAAALETTYVDGAQGRAEHAAFDAERTRIRRAALKAKRAHAFAIAGQVAQAAAVAVEQGTGRTDAVGAMKANQSIADSSAATEKIFGETMTRINRAQGLLNTASQEDASGVETGKLFSGNLAVALMVSARDPNEYLKVIHDTAATRGWAGLAQQSADLQASAETLTDADLKALAGSFDELELSVVKKERLRRTPRPAGATP